MILGLWALAGCVPGLEPPLIADNPNHDFDGDGFTERDGDCDDQDETATPDGALLCGARPAAEADGGLFFTGGGSFGAALDQRPDTDDDGWAELVVGNPTYVIGKKEVGGAGVYDGPWEGTRSTEELPWPNGLPDAAGTSVAAVGDYAGNGKATWALGLPIADGLGWWFVVSGDTDVVDQGTGLQQGWELGASMDTVPDYDENGRPELIVGAPGGDRARVYAYSERAIDLTGPSGSRTGSAVLAAPDLDGDGQVDVVVAGSGPGLDGVVYLLSGPLSAGDADLGKDALEIEGEGGEGLGGSLAEHDLDGDGHPDLILGAPGASSDAGAVVVVRGPSFTEGAWLRIEGEEAGDRAGASVAALRDHDGDGAADLVVGAPGRGEGAGAAYLLTRLEPGSLSLAEARGVLEGQAEQALGSALSAGDLQGDGLSDVAIGAPGADGGGAVYLLFGDAP